MAVVKDLVSTILIMMLVVGTFLILLLLFKQTNIIEALEYETVYRTVGPILNSVVVLGTCYLIAISDKSNIIKILLVILLFVGILTEIFLIIGFSNAIPVYGLYIMIVANFLIRTVILVNLAQSPWYQMTIATSSASLAPQVKSLENVVLPPKVEKVVDAEYERYINQFRALLKQAKEKVGPDNFDQRSYDKALNEIVKPAAAAKDYSLDKLKEGAALFKDRSGNPITDLVFGGRRKR